VVRGVRNELGIRTRLILGLALTAIVASPAAGAQLSFAEAPATRSPEITLKLDGPPSAVRAVVSASPRFERYVHAPAKGTIPWRLSPGSDGRRYAWVRFLDEAGKPIDALLRAEIILDRAHPTTDRARLVFRGKVRYCRAGDAPVAGGLPTGGRLRLTGVSDLSPVADARALGSNGRPGPWRPLRSFRPSASVNSALGVQVRDAAGNATPWITLATPQRRRIAHLDRHTEPFSFAHHCDRRSPRAVIHQVNAKWALSRRPLADRARVRPGGSALVWTNYEKQGLYPNWVHAGTELNERLRRRRVEDYRAGVSEVLALSRSDRAGRHTYRVNENHFTTPDDRRSPPWRDGMGTAVLLALLIPAIPPGDTYEDALARKAAREYLATFAVSHRDGGALWTDRGPGAWYLEYTYRSQRRVLNGFMQSLVSLDRFSRQAGKRAKHDPSWRPLAQRARGLVRRGGISLTYWLPRYDLGPGKTRYALGSGPASEQYRAYHVQLLQQLARVSHLTPAQKKRFRAYAARWSR
jgi:hypothetical protein